jgi:dihydroneopterin aldolase
MCQKTPVSDVIELRELRVSAVVGVLSEERDRPQPLAFDIDIERPMEEAAMNDDLAETTNYAELLSLTTTVARDGAFLLLETLAYRVARELLAFDDAIISVTVAVRKLRPPVAEDVATVGVRCTVTRP